MMIESCSNTYYDDAVGVKHTIHVRDCGRPVNLDGTGVEIKYVAPNRDEMTVTATVVDAANGVIQYVFQEDELVQIGTWRYTVVLTDPEYFSHLPAGEFNVRRHLTSVN